MNNIIVNESCKNLRMLGYNGLNGKWRTSIGAVILSLILISMPALFIVILIEGNSGFESILINIETLLIEGPVTLGMSMLMLSLFRNKHKNFTYIFNGFEYFLKAVSLMFITGLFIFLWSLLFIIPGIIAAIRYSQAFYILADDPNKDIFQCIEESKWLMSGNKWKYFSMLFSFIGWAIVSALTFGVGLVILQPYIYMTQVAFYEIITGNLIENKLEEYKNEI